MIRTRSLFALGFVLLVAGCSLVNALEDVKRTSEGDYVANDASVAPLPVGSAPDAAPPPPDATAPLNGAIVVSGLERVDGAADRYVLTALDPVTGKELSRSVREQLTVAAIKYDDARDLWYIFESTNGDFVPGPLTTVYLHVRKLEGNGVWTELSKTAVPVPHFYESIAILRDRLSYVAYANEAGTTLELATFDTANPSAIAQMSSLTLSRAPTIVMPTRSATGPGGVVNLLQTNTGACDDAGLCDVEVVPVQVPNNGQPVFGVTRVVGQAGRNSIVSGAASVQHELDVIILPRLANGLPTYVQQYQPITGDPEGNPIAVNITDTGLRRAAIADCDNVAFVVGTNSDLNVHAIPLGAGDAGVPSKVNTGHSGQAVYYEPFTKTVLAPFNQGGGFDYTAFRLGGTSAAPVLTRRDADWTPPTDVRPILLGIRAPMPFTCP